MFRGEALGNFTEFELLKGSEMASGATYFIISTITNPLKYPDDLGFLRLFDCSVWTDINGKFEWSVITYRCWAVRASACDETTSFAKGVFILVSTHDKSEACEYV